MMSVVPSKESATLSKELSGRETNTSSAVLATSGDEMMIPPHLLLNVQDHQTSGQNSNKHCTKVSSDKETESAQEGVKEYIRVTADGRPHTKAICGFCVCMVLLLALVVAWGVQLSARSRTKKIIVHLDLQPDSLSRIAQIAFKPRRLQSIEEMQTDDGPTDDDEESPFDIGATVKSSEVLMVRDALRMEKKVIIGTSTYIPDLEADALEEMGDGEEITVGGPVSVEMVSLLSKHMRRLGESGEQNDNAVEAMHYIANCDLRDEGLEEDGCSVELFSTVREESQFRRLQYRRLCGRRRRRRRRRRAPPSKQLIEPRFTSSWSSQADWASSAVASRTELGRLCLSEIVSGQANAIRGADRWNGFRADGGHYGVQRQPGPRYGIDLAGRDGDMVQAPIPATIVSQTRASVVLQGREEWSNIYLTVSYLECFPRSNGTNVNPGDALGRARSMQSKFPGIHDHVHLRMSLRTADQSHAIDPTDYMCNRSFNSGAAEWNQVSFILEPNASICPAHDAWINNTDMQADSVQACASQCTHGSGLSSSIVVDLAGRCACSIEACTVASSMQHQAFSLLGKTGFEVLATPGLRCGRLVPLPSGLNPYRLHPLGDPAQECAARCIHAYGPQRGFHLFKDGSRCSCSSVACSNFVTDSNYTYYRIVKVPSWAACAPLPHNITLKELPPEHKLSMAQRPKPLIPPRLDLFSNPAKECAMRCAGSDWHRRPFFLSVERRGCACAIESGIEASANHGRPHMGVVTCDDNETNCDDNETNWTLAVVAETKLMEDSKIETISASDADQYLLFKLEENTGLRRLDESFESSLCKERYDDTELPEGDDGQSCKKWYVKEPEPTWAARLPPCPPAFPAQCTISFLYGEPEFELVDKRFVHDLKCRFPDCDSEYHPGAAGCLRSAEAVPGEGEYFEGNRHGQQCCYHRDGSLITSIPGAGTADREAGSLVNFVDHIRRDVTPWGHCCKTGVDPKFCCLYYAKRPMNLGDGYQLPPKVSLVDCDFACGLTQCLSYDTTTTTTQSPVDKGIIHFHSHGEPHAQEWYFTTPPGETSLISFDEDTMVNLNDKVTVLDGGGYVAALLTSSARADGFSRGPPQVCAEGMVLLRYEEGSRTAQQQGREYMTRVMATWKTIPSSHAPWECGPQFDESKGEISYADAMLCSGTKSIDLLELGQAAWMTDYPAVSRYGSNMWCEWRLSSRRRYQIRVSFRHMDLERQTSADKCYDAVKLFDGPDANSEKKSVCGFGPPQAFTSTQGGVTVRFQSDENGAGYGFVARAIAVSESSDPRDGTEKYERFPPTRYSRTDCNCGECATRCGVQNGQEYCYREDNFFDGCRDIDDTLVVVVTLAVVAVASCR